MEAETGAGWEDISDIAGSSWKMGSGNSADWSSNGWSDSIDAAWAKAFNRWQQENIANTQASMAAQWFGEAEIATKLAGMFAGWSNELFAKRYAASKVGEAWTQMGINSLHEAAGPITRESDESPYWNLFGNDAINQEKVHSGYMNDRNAIIASSVALNNDNFKFMSNAEREDAITRDIINRQEYGIDENIRDWYDQTIDTVNWLLSKNVPELKADDYFNMMLNGQDTTWVSSNNPMYQAGKRRYDKLNSYVNMGEAGITDAVTNSTLLPGSNEWNDLITKGFGAVLTQAQSTMSSETSVTTSLMTEIMGFNPDNLLASQAANSPLFEWLEWQISLAILNTMTEDQLPSFAQFLLDDEEVQKQRMLGADTVAEINVLNQQIGDLSDSMKEMFVENGGTDEDTAFMAAYVTEKSKPMIRKLDMLQTKYGNEAAMLQIASENARTEYDSLKYNKQAKLDTYNFLLGMIDKQYARDQGEQALAFQKRQYEENKAFQQQQFDRQKAGSPIDTPSVASGNITSFDLSINPGQTAESNAAFAGAAAALGMSASALAWAQAALGNSKQNIQLDEAAMKPFVNALHAMNKAGVKVWVWDTIRTEEKQRELVDKWLSWTMDSKHLKGMAVDIYGGQGKGGKLLKPTTENIQHMNANGWYQPAATLAKWDYWHFEFRGMPGGESNTLYQGIMNGSTSKAEIYSPKNLTTLGLEWQTQTQISEKMTTDIMNKYINENTSTAEINDLREKANKVIWATEEHIIAATQSAMGVKKTLEYLNDETAKVSTKAEVAKIAPRWKYLVESNGIEKGDMKDRLKAAWVRDTYGKNLYNNLY